MSSNKIIVLSTLMLVAISDLFGQSQQVRADLIELGGVTPVRLLTGGGSDTVRLQFPSTSGELAAKPFTVSAPTGSVVRYAADPVPSGYTKCHGQNAYRSQYQALYSAIGTAFGAGDGATTFTLPDAGPIPSNGLVGWWPFNGNANDESGLGTNGVVTGATLTTDRFGVANSAYYYDGIDQIDMANYPQIVNAQGTISLWFKTAYVGKQGILFIETMPGNFNEHVAISWYEYVDRLEGDVKFNSGCKPGKGWTKAFSTLSYKDDKWHHAVQTWGDGAVKLYVDGELVGVQPSPLNNADVCANATMILTIGLGKIDDVAIYNRILTASERARLFGAESSRIMSIIKY